MSLQEKSDEEISDLLDQYGIRHGPIVGEQLIPTIWMTPASLFISPECVHQQLGLQVCKLKVQFTPLVGVDKVMKLKLAY